MAKNYFEHETQVKYVESLLSNSNQWQWLIDYIEKNFEVETEADSYESFINCFSAIRDIYVHIIKINEVSPTTVLSFSQPWLEKVYKIAEIFNGRKVFVKNNFDSDFFNMLSIAAYITHLINIKNDLDYVVDFRIFTTTNLYEILDLSGVRKEYTQINEALREIRFNSINRISDVFNKNIHKEHQSFADDFFNIYKDNLENANAFSMQRIKNPPVATWQERYLLDMVMVRIDKQSLVPFAQFENNSTPDISLWSKDILSKMVSFFSNDTASFVIETIQYIVYGIKISDSIIQKHFELLTNFLEQHISDITKTHELECSSLKVCSYLLSDGIISQTIKPTCMSLIACKISKIKEFSVLLLMDKYDLPINKNQRQQVNDYHKKEYQRIHSIIDSNDLCEYFLNRDVQKYIDKECFAEAHARFLEIISKIKGSFLANIFYIYMIFLLELQKNPAIQQNVLRTAVIQIKHLWQEQYYELCCQSMHEFSHQFTMEKAQIDSQKKAIIDKPFAVAHAAMLQKTDDIVQKLELFSSNPFTILNTSLQVSEYFLYKYDVKLDGQHVVDNQISKIFDKINHEHGYRFLNAFDTTKYMPHMFEAISQTISWWVQVFTGEEELYKMIEKKIPNYRLLSYPCKEVTLGHVTQLFPILECKIREIGELCNIVPFRMQVSDYMRVKEPSSILSEILKEIYELAGTHEGASDLLFVYFSMYNSNGLNVRNECIHGKAFQKPEQLKFAFKLTLICLHMVLWRLEQLRKNSSS